MKGIRLRIGLEVSPLAVNATGIPNYIRRLLEGFASLEGDDDFFLYTNRPIPFGLGLPENFRTVVVDRPYPRFQLWFQLGLPRRMRRDGVQVFHGLFSRLPFALSVPGVVTVYDISGYAMPGLHKRWTHMTNLLYPLYLRKAAAVVAISHFTASELRRRFPWLGDGISVAQPAAPPGFAPVKDPGSLQAVRMKYGLPERFILFLGTLEPRKNLRRLLEAYRSIAGRVPHSLVIAGGSGWRSGGLLEGIGGGEHRDRVLLTGFVDQEDLPALFSLAEVFVYPSIYEGFGLPILEAMACGTPVVTSSVSSMPEVAGEAAVLADPFSVEAMADAILRLAMHEDLRNEMRERGFRRERDFSWKAAAARTMEVYREVLEGAGR